MNQFKELNKIILISMLIVLGCSAIVAVLINDIILLYVGLGVLLFGFVIVLVAELLIIKMCE
jgi:hypothetical protein